MGKDVKNFFYSISVVNEWNEISEEQKMLEMLTRLKNDKTETNASEMGPHEWRNPYLYCTNT